MGNSPLISVVMSIYDEPIEWIEQAIDSILNQSFVHFEFIIVNDNPNRKDNELILKSFQEKDNRIKGINNDINIGLAASLNKGIKVAKGKYIARMDADDISLPQRFEKQIRFLEKNEEYGICGTLARKIDNNSKYGRKINLQIKDKALKNAIYFFCPFLHPSVMIKKNLFDKCSYDEKCRIGQDWDLWKQFAGYTKFANIPNILLLYRIHQNQSPVKAGLTKSKESRIWSANKDIKVLELNNENAKLYLNFKTNVKLSEQELDILFFSLSKNKHLKDSYRYIISIFTRNKINYSVFSLINNRLFKDKPLSYTFAVIWEFFRWIKNII